MRSLTLMLSTIALVSTISACGSTNTGHTAASSAVPRTSSSPRPLAPLTARAVILGLKADTPSISVSVVYTAATDPNHELGRPGGYTSKAAFVDSRINPSSVSDSSTGSVALGGGVEVFPSNKEAMQRAHYIQTVTSGVPALTEYDYVAGGVVLRLSSSYTPAEAQLFATSLSSVVGVKATAVTP